MSKEVIKTQEMLGKYVSKPPLTEKLLSKPPFRYLHDILNVVIKNHGFLQGLYTDSELQSDHVKDKEAKITFLQKWIDATSLAIGETLDVRPSKIVSGHEVDNTNLLLQATAKAIEKKIDSSKAVNQVLSQPKTTKRESKTRDKTKEKRESKNEKSPKKENPSQKTKVPEVKPSRSRPNGTSNPTTTISESKGPDKPTRKSRDPSKATVGAEAPPRVKRKERIVLQKESKSSHEMSSSREKRNQDTKKSRVTKGQKEAKEKTGKSTKPKAKSEIHKPKKQSPNAVESGKDITPPTAVLHVGDVVNDEGADQEPVDMTTSVKGADMLGPQDDSNVEPDIFGSPGQEVSNGPLNKSEFKSIPSEENALPANKENDFPTQEVMSPSHPVPPDIDPAILKAIRGNEDALSDGNRFNSLGGTTDPSDSGVGSLESPKHATKENSLPNEAEQKALSPVPAPPMTPGPRPASLKAYHPDLPEADLGLPTGISAQAEALPERPKTGMGLRPRTGRRSARPPSARPAPPKVRERREIPPEEMPRPSTGKPMTNLILDSQNKDKNTGIDDDGVDDDDTFTVGNQETLLDEDATIERVMDTGLEKEKQELLEGDQNAKGILVAQILETKKELEDTRREAFSPETPGHRRVLIEQTLQGDANRRKEKEHIQKDVEKLTSSIQALTRSVNPLAKMLDYLQEDFDSMQKELESWRKEEKTLEQSLKAEQSLTEQQLEPLRRQLEEMDAAIFDQRDRISAIKSVILRNEEKSTRLLAGININS